MVVVMVVVPVQVPAGEAAQSERPIHEPECDQQQPGDRGHPLADQAEQLDAEHEREHAEQHRDGDMTEPAERGDPDRAAARPPLRARQDGEWHPVVGRERCVASRP